jgi:RNA polymerase sigma factor (sigma-70 family)
MDRSVREISDVELLEQISRGNRLSFEQLYVRHSEAVYLYACAMLARTADAEDASQETWVAFWKARGRMVLAADTALPWLLVTVRHKSLNVLSKRARSEPPPIAYEIVAEMQQADPVGMAESAEVRSFIDDLVRQLSDIDRSIFERCIRDGESYASASRALGVTLGTVRNRLARIRKRLRTAITPEGQTK